MATTKDTKPAAKPPAHKPTLPDELKTEVRSLFERGRLTPHDWRHVALDVADLFGVAFADVEAFIKKEFGL